MSDSTGRAYYESDQILSEYLLFHYGRDSEVLPHESGPKAALNYPIRCITECLDVAGVPAGARALDLGCAVGRSAFELARHATEVLGIDTSSAFIAAADHLRTVGQMAYSARDQGELRSPLLAEVPPDIDRDRVRFEVGDALALPADIGDFDIILMANLIDRLPRPNELMRRLPDLVRPGGQLIISSPYTWLEEFTPRDEWLGGFERDGKIVTTFDTLTAFLEPNFKLVLRQDLPFLIREHARKYQWSVAEATVWQRRTS